MAAQEYYNSFNQANPPPYPPPQYHPFASPPQVHQPVPPQLSLADHKPNDQQMQPYNTPPQGHAQQYYPPQNPQYLQPPQVRPPQRVRFDDEDESDESEEEQFGRRRSVSEPPRHHHHHHHHDRHDSRDRSRTRDRSRDGSRDRSRDNSRDRSRDRSGERSRRPKAPDHKSRNTFLGAVGGSVIGDAIFPGLGTIGGLVLGGLGGREVARSHSERPPPRRKHKDRYDYEWEEGRRRRGEID